MPAAPLEDGVLAVRSAGGAGGGGDFQQPFPAGSGGPGAASCSGPLPALLQWGAGAQHPGVALFAPLFMS